MSSSSPLEFHLLVYLLFHRLAIFVIITIYLPTYLPTYTFLLLSTTSYLLEVTRSTRQIFVSSQSEQVRILGFRSFQLRSGYALRFVWFAKEGIDLTWTATVDDQCLYVRMHRSSSIVLQVFRSFMSDFLSGFVPCFLGSFERFLFYCNAELLAGSIWFEQWCYLTTFFHVGEFDTISAHPLRFWCMYTLTARSMSPYWYVLSVATRVFTNM
jgi:hypothetical protein